MSCDNQTSLCGVCLPACLPACLSRSLAGDLSLVWQEAGMSCHEGCAVGISERTEAFRNAFNDPDLHNVNVLDIEASQSMIKKLAKMDRLPKYEKLEGLLLLRQAWDE